MSKSMYQSVEKDGNGYKKCSKSLDCRFVLSSLDKKQFQLLLCLLISNCSFWTENYFHHMEASSVFHPFDGSDSSDILWLQGSLVALWLDEWSWREKRKKKIPANLILLKLFHTVVWVYLHEVGSWKSLGLITTRHSHYFFTWKENDYSPNIFRKKKEEKKGFVTRWQNRILPCVSYSIVIIWCQLIK